MQSIQTITQVAMCYMAVIPALRRLRQEDHKFEANLRYKGRLCLKVTKPKAKK
jgi:hypothetical protein